MEITEQGILALLKSAVTGEALSLPEGFDLHAAVALIKAHKIAPLMYEGAVNCGISQEHPVMHSLFQSSCRAIQVNARQLHELDRIYAAFEAAGIDFLPLKGSMMKRLYPKSELRLMGDADILIREEQYEQIVPMMQSLGYRWVGAMNYENTWHHEALHLELHSGLFSPDEKDLYAYFDTGWKFAKVENKTCYEMTPEDAFVYAVAHFAKHFRGSGIGCRHMVDLWVFLRHYPELNEGYIRKALETLRLWTFYQNVRRTLAWWFEEGKPTEQAERISKFIFDCGNWGDIQTATISAELRRHKAVHGTAWSRCAYILRHLFPEAERMHTYYPVLDRVPWMLPASWIYRLVTKLFVHNRSWRHYAHNVKALTSDNMDKRQRMLQDVGL